MLVVLVIGLLVIPLTVSHDRAELFLSYLKALVWPVGLVAFGYVLRDRLGGLVDRLRSAEIPGGKFEFVERIEAAAQATTSAAAEVQQSARDIDSRLELLRLFIDMGLVSRTDVDAPSVLRKLHRDPPPDTGNAGNAAPEV